MPGTGVQAQLRVRVPAPGARCPCPPGRGGDNGALCRPLCPAPNPGHGAGGRAPRGGAGGFKGHSRPVSPVPGVPEPSSPVRSQATKVPGAGAGDTAVPAWGPQGQPPARGGAGTRRSPCWWQGTHRSAGTPVTAPCLGLEGPCPGWAGDRAMCPLNLSLAPGHPMGTAHRAGGACVGGCKWAALSSVPQFPSVPRCARHPAGSWGTPRGVAGRPRMPGSAPPGHLAPPGQGLPPAVLSWHGITLIPAWAQPELLGSPGLAPRGQPGVTKGCPRRGGCCWWGALCAAGLGRGWQGGDTSPGSTADSAHPSLAAPQSPGW